MSMLYLSTGLFSSPLTICLSMCNSCAIRKMYSMHHPAKLCVLARALISITHLPQFSIQPDLIIPTTFVLLVSVGLTRLSDYPYESAVKHINWFHVYIRQKVKVSDYRKVVPSIQKAQRSAMLYCMSRQ